MKQRIIIIWGLLAATCLYSFSAHAEGENACHHFADAIRQQVVGIFHNQSMNYAQKRKALSNLFEHSVDIDWIARFVAGAAWRSASDQQRADYIKAYKAYLSGHYIGGLNEDDLNGMMDLVLLDFKQIDANAYSAHAQITQKNEEPVAIDLRLEEEPASVCHVRDFTLEGISLLTSQRDQIQELASKGGLPYVTQRLTEFALAKS